MFEVLRRIRSCPLAAAPAADRGRGPVAGPASPHRRARLSLGAAHRDQQLAGTCRPMRRSRSARSAASSSCANIISGCRSARCATGNGGSCASDRFSRASRRVRQTRIEHRVVLVEALVAAAEQDPIADLHVVRLVGHAHDAQVRAHHEIPERAVGADQRQRARRSQDRCGPRSGQGPPPSRALPRRPPDAPAAAPRRKCGAAFERARVTGDARNASAQTIRFIAARERNPFGKFVALSVAELATFGGAHPQSCRIPPHSAADAENSRHRLSCSSSASPTSSGRSPRCSRSCAPRRRATPPRSRSASISPRCAARWRRSSSRPMRGCRGKQARPRRA